MCNATQKCKFCLVEPKVSVKLAKESQLRIMYIINLFYKDCIQKGLKSQKWVKNCRWYKQWNSSCTKEREKIIQDLLKLDSKMNSCKEKLSTPCNQFLQPNHDSGHKPVCHMLRYHYDLLHLYPCGSRQVIHTSSSQCIHFDVLITPVVHSIWQEQFTSASSYVILCVVMIVEGCWILE